MRASERVAYAVSACKVDPDLPLAFRIARLVEGTIKSIFIDSGNVSSLNRKA
jgi:DNA-binding XRE family transcriptional regulator